MKDFFDALNVAIRGGEQSLVNFLSAVGPWAAPLAPAFMSYNHMIDTLGFPIWIALSVAIVVEILGLSAVSTILAFWTYNKRRVAEYKKAPVWIVLLAFGFYLAVILVINVALDASRLYGVDQATAELAARALLTMLSIPAAVILAVRTQHKELLDQAEQERRERKEQAGEKRQQPQEKHTAESGRKKKFNADVRSGELSFYLSEKNLTTPGQVVAEIVTLYGVSERTAWRWWDEIKNVSLIGKVD